MILQRISSAIRRQDWFQVIIEVMIVVIGIFLGLQVQAAYEDREDAIAAGDYTEQLLVDTRLAIEISDRRIEIANRRLIQIDELLNVLKGKELNENNREDFETALSNIKFFQPPEISIGHVGDVINGQLPTVITDENIIRAAIELERQFVSSIGRFEHSQELLNIWTATLGKYYVSQMPGYEHHGYIYDLDQLRSSPEFIYAVQNALGIQLIGVAQNRSIGEQLAKFLNALEEAQ